MAATYETRIGSTASGAFAIYPVETTGADVIPLFNADVVTGDVTLATNGAALSALERTALSTLLKALISTQAVGGNVLTYLRKLVGVVTLVNGTSTTLGVVNVAGNVWTLQATASGAGQYLVYVPSSVSAGLYTGLGADAAAGGAAGAAGGDLSGLYPNPSVIGLQGDALPATGANTFVKRNSLNNSWETVTYGAAANTVAQGNDSRIVNAIQTGAAAGGDLSGTLPNPSVAGLQGQALAATVANGFVKRNAANGAWEQVAYGTAANTVCQGNDSRVANALQNGAAAGGALAGTYPNPTLSTPIPTVQAADMSTFMVGLIPTGVNVLMVAVPTGKTITLVQANCVAFAKTTATVGAAVFTVRKFVGSTGAVTAIGTLTFAVGSRTGTFSAFATSTLNAGDVLELVPPSPANATLADVSVTFAATTSI